MLRPSEKPHPVRHRPTFSDTLFLAVLALVLVAVAGVGRMAYVNGQKNEFSKKNALAWATWLEQAGADRFKEDYELSGCAGGDAANGQTWADCLPLLTGFTGPLSDMQNPFTQQPLVFATKCDPSNKSLAGALVIERLVPTAPGSVVPFYPMPLTDRDPTDQRMQLRVTACDQGAYAGKAIEVTF